MQLASTFVRQYAYGQQPLHSVGMSAHVEKLTGGDRGSGGSNGDGDDGGARGGGGLGRGGSAGGDAGGSGDMQQRSIQLMYATHSPVPPCMTDRQTGSDCMQLL